MKLFSWVQNRLNGKQGSNKATVISPPIKREEKEEFSDWPQAFLSIGTLGNKDLKEDTTTKAHPNNNNFQSTQENLTSEEVKELQKELNALVSSSTNLDTFTKLLEAKEEIKTNGDDHHEEIDHDDQQKHFATINASNNNIAISKKSVSFLLKKMFICGSAGLGPTPSLRDHSFLSPPHSRMEKILRAILNKKIHPQGQSQPMSKKKYLESRQIAITENDNDDDYDYDSDYDDRGHGNEGSSKWVKTDTEYIVLEI